MAEALKAEKADELGNPIKRLTATARPRPRPAKKARVDTPVARADTPVIEVSSDEEDLDYEATECATDPAETEDELSEWLSEFPSMDDSIEVLPSNAEVRSFLFLLFFPFLHIYRLPTCSHPRQSQKWGGALPESGCALRTGRWHSSCLRHPSMKVTLLPSLTQLTITMRTL
jgi:hypothetical protein